VAAVSTPEHLAPPGDGRTPLDGDEVDGLRLTWVATRGQLLDQEAKGLQRVAVEHLQRVPALGRLLDDVWLRRLHERIFGAVRSWAGRYRTTGKSIGLDWTLVPTAVRDLLADAALWFAHDDVDLAAARLHHRLVEIHPFPDGNGRHARVHTDLCLRAVGALPFTWGRLRDEPDAAKRAAYLAALRHADRTRDVAPLRAYCRT